MKWLSSRGGFGAGAVVLAACLFASSIALAGSGGPDRTFGDDGHVVAPLAGQPDAEPADMGIDREGRIVVAGTYVSPLGPAPLVARFRPDGSLDQSFGAGGVVAPQWGGEAMITGVAIDSAGRIALGGRVAFSADSDLFVARLLENGQIDLGFGGGDGLLTFEAGGSDSESASDLTLDAQGRILLALNVWYRQPELQFAVARVTEAGALDPSFGEDGIAGVDLGMAADPSAVAVDSQGRVVLAGQGGPFKGVQFAAARFDAAGRPDPSFDGDGGTLLSFGTVSPGEGAGDLAIDARDRLLLVGGGGSGFALAGRLLPDGSPDPSFDGDGRLLLPLEGSGASGVAIDPEGRILMAGTVSEGTTGEAFLARFRPAGILDRSFGRAGIVREDYSTPSAMGRSVAVDSEGRYLLTGAVVGPPRRFALARYLGDQGRCRGKQATLAGTAQGDVLRGTRGSDVIVGLGGDDRIRGFGGRDLICAGRGRDLVRAGRGNDVVFGGRGNDRLFGQAGRDRLRGGAGRDRIVGGPGRDR